MPFAFVYVAYSFFLIWFPCDVFNVVFYLYCVCVNDLQII